MRSVDKKQFKWSFDQFGTIAITYSGYALGIWICGCRLFCEEAENCYKFYYIYEPVLTSNNKKQDCVTPSKKITVNNNDLDLTLKVFFWHHPKKSLNLIQNLLKLTKKD